MSNSNGSTTAPTVQQATNAAKSLGLEADGRTANSIDLVVSGAVTLHTDNSATVVSGDRSYFIDGSCHCHDSEYNSQPDGCKHLRAVRLARALGTLNRHISEFDHPEPAALAEVWGDDQPTYHDPEPATTNGTTWVERAKANPPVGALESVAVIEETWPVPHWSQQDAPCIHTVKWTDRVTGIEHCVVLRADTWDDLLPQIAQVSKVAKAHREVPADDSPEAASLATDPSWCGVHGTTMKASQDGKGFFHKAGEKADGKAIWCRGK